MAHAPFAAETLHHEQRNECTISNGHDAPRPAVNAHHPPRRIQLSNHVRITGINLTRDSNNYRKLTVGRKRKDELFYSAMDEYKKEGEKKRTQKIKGMQSFILSVEGEAYEDSYSSNMKSAIKELGFNSLKELIDSL